MLLYLVNFINAFIPVSVMTGMLLGLSEEAEGRKPFRPFILSLIAGLLSGIIIYIVSFKQGTVTSARTFLYASAALTAFINAGTFILIKRFKIVSISFTAVLASAATFSFLGFIAEQALSNILVLNTEMILNIGGILTGAFIIAFFIPLTFHMSNKSGKGIAIGFILFVSALLITQWCAEVLLGMMRLEMAGLTSARLSFVAKVTKYSRLLPYIQVFILAVLSLIFFIRKPALAPNGLSGMQKSEYRKARSTVLFEMRWFKTALTSICVILAVMLYHDLYASRPPKISPPVNLKPDSGGLIKVRIDEVRDGKLHRYSYITDDGHVVRFFMINRVIRGSGAQNRIGVVYDACMLCGDMGYIQKKNEIICIACNVRIFIPSIGKAGGCNPIPLNHKVEGEHIVISVEELYAGARYFSEVISIKVKDPVTGKELINLKAPYRYEYKGRTYFFESEETEKKFKTSPETYIGELQPRYFRAQGYRNE